MMDNKYFLLACNRIPGLGPKRVFNLLTIWPNLADLFSAKQSDLENIGLPLPVSQAIQHFNFKQVDADLKWEEDTCHRILTIEDPLYPPILKEIYDPPLVLYAKGDLSSLKQKAIAMVGSRNPSPSGVDIAYQFAKDLASYELTLVSGLAIGIDSQIHEGCLAANGSTIAVMATGIDRIYPQRNGQLAQKIVEKGLLLSEFPLKTAPTPGHFPRRNRIISGLALITVVVEAALKSGSLITAQLALEQNRDVLAIPGSIYNPQSRGCHRLVQQGAKLVSSIDDILQEIGIEARETQQTSKAKLAKVNKNLVKFIGFEATSIDTLCQRSGLTIELVTCALAELEIHGLIKAVPGGYLRCAQ